MTICHVERLPCVSQHRVGELLEGLDACGPLGPQGVSDKIRRLNRMPYGCRHMDFLHLLIDALHQSKDVLTSLDHHTNSPREQTILLTQNTT